MMNFLHNITPTTYVIIGTIIIQIIGLVVISIIFKDDLNGWYFNSIFWTFCATLVICISASLLYNNGLLHKGNQHTVIEIHIKNDDSKK